MMLLVTGVKYITNCEPELIKSKRYHKLKNAQEDVISMIDKFLNEHGEKLKEGGLELEIQKLEDGSYLYMYGNHLLYNCPSHCNVMIKIEEFK